MESALSTWATAYNPAVTTSDVDLDLYRACILDLCRKGLSELSTPSITTNLHLYNLNLMYCALFKDAKLVDDGGLFYIITRYFKHMDTCRMWFGEFWLCDYNCFKPPHVNIKIKVGIKRHERVVSWTNWHWYFNSFIKSPVASKRLIRKPFTESRLSAILHTHTLVQLVGLRKDHPHFKKKFHDMLLRTHPDKNNNRLANDATKHLLKLLNKM